ncbi:MAG: preprotein translocase subunit YajC [Clostridiales bacterium]|nr:preprotein translocase subunit YajC [Clostridiales bacterium]MBS5878375.1 preprotein translocase subunit YajC [Clostridiales bacterium]MDU0939841.1 preprotein translocase subunit YajC [Clostridiales bacterium]MDU1042685.1 preprotein translocase subunit YajC [Clostridiales bacterium]MDU3489538.1 preprotein translocase subunit YajC [Clostridiales bacterium]
MNSNPTSIILMVVYLAAIIIFMYFMAFRPQKKRQKLRREMMDNMSAGDFVLTTSGFYGEVVDIEEDTVIVEFGNNKNCRIAMKRDAIEQVEKANPTYTSTASAGEDK